MGNTADTSGVRFLSGSFSQAWNALRTRYGALLLATLILVAITAPIESIQLLSSGASQRIQERQAAMKAAASAHASQAMAEQAAGMAGDFAILIGTGCTVFVLSLLLMYPAITSAALAGATAVSGRSMQGQYFRGFKRYGWTLLAWLLVVAAGIAISIPFACIVGFVLPVIMVASGGMSSSGASEDAERAQTVMIVIVSCIMAIPMAWLTVRFGWGLMRVADGARPNLGPIASYGRSWRATAGSVQWRILGSFIVFSLIAAVLMAPGLIMAWMGQEQESDGLYYGGIALGVATAVFVVYPWVLALYGSVYEALMSLSGDEQPSAQVGFD